MEKLIDIVRGAGVSRYAVYGFPGSQGGYRRIATHGFGEVRLFEGERGRGGKIVKVRIKENAVSNVG